VVSVYVHGGVSGAPRRRATELGYAVDAGRACSHRLDAVEAAVRALEDDPALNAGYGSVLNHAGRIELDAGLADGAGPRVASVAGVWVRHPISLARHVLDHTPHVFMAGAGAMKLAQRAGLERLAATTPEQQRRWRDAAASEDDADFGQPEQVDTVGAVAIDGRGRLAAGSSTGGVGGQLEGRIGDSPLFGAGLYASASAAVVGTGLGELFVTTLASARTGALLERGVHPQEACARILARLARGRLAPAGLLALDSRGRVGAAFRGASWTLAGPEGALEAQRVGPALP
jgi:beta-aspartyl-peptidase (threonine type)